MTAPTSNLPQNQAAQVNLRTLLEEMLERGASDLHITTGERPMLRIDGDIQPSKQGGVQIGRASCRERG